LLGGLFKLTNNRSPAEAFAGIPNKQAYEALEMRRFIAKHKLDRFKRNPFFPVNTLQIMRCAIAAKRLGCFEPYVNAMYSAMWEQGRNMSEVLEITDVLTTAGIDAARLLETAQMQDVKSQLLANTQSAFERGAFGSPTFFVGDAMYFGKDRLRDVEEEIVRLSTALPTTNHLEK
jgi:2-hydroxychromene-2-carboxylate isomerase